jgi:surfactin synthase thioesterase subunit
MNARMPKVTLVCLAHAGGSVALYREWQARLPAWVRVHTLELPGHGARRVAPLHAAWPALIEQLSTELRSQLDMARPFAVFGHSMGALVGLELIHAMRRFERVSPVWFGASATIAPRRRAIETQWLGASHDMMLDKLRERGGTPPELLADRDFLDLVMPVMRADFHLCGDHPRHAATAARPPLDCPISVLTGCDDIATASADDVAAWSQETHGDFAARAFEGGHFYLDDAPQAVLAYVAESLAHALAQRMRDAPAASEEGAAWTH